METLIEVKEINEPKRGPGRPPLPPEEKERREREREETRVYRKTLAISFPVERENLSKIVFPNLEDKRKREVEIWHIYPRLTDYNANLITWEDVNPRSHGEEALKSSIAREIKDTLLGNAANFHVINRGIAILAESVEYDSSKKTVEIRLTDNEKHGICDGATTSLIISRMQKQAMEEKNFDETEWPENLQVARVHLEVILNLEDREKVAEIVEARNKSRQVKQFSLSNFRGDFDWIKEILEKSEFAGRIGYEENSSQDVTILDVLSLICLFHPEWDDPNIESIKAPTVAYSSKGRLDSRLTNEKLLPGYKGLSRLLPDILRLHDKIYAEFPKHYDLAFKTKTKDTKLGRRLGFESRLLGNKYILPLTKVESDYVIANGVIYPLLAAFRALISYSEDLAVWKADPFKFYDDHGQRLVKVAIAQLEEVGNNANKLGKSRTAYTNLHTESRYLLIK